jgi:hypothetical protein
LSSTWIQTQGKKKDITKNFKKLKIIMKDGKLKLKTKWLIEEVHTFICFQHDVNNDQNHLSIGLILNYFMCIYILTNSYMVDAHVN